MASKTLRSDGVCVGGVGWGGVKRDDFDMKLMEKMMTGE